MKHAPRRRATPCLPSSAGHARKSGGNGRTVIVAFLLSLLGFGSTLLLPYVLDRVSAAPSPEETDAAAGRVRTLLVFFHDDDGVLTGAVTVTGNTREMTLTTEGYPPETEIIHGTDLTTLALCYQEDRDAALTGFCEASRQSCDGAISLSVTAVGQFLTRLQDCLPYTLPAPVGALPAGEVTLTPLQAAGLLTYRGWDNPDGVAALHAGLTAAACNHYLTTSRNTQADFGALAPLCDRRLHISQFMDCRDDLAALAAANTDGTFCTTRAAPGRWIASGTRFVPS